MQPDRFTFTTLLLAAGRSASNENESKSNASNNINSDSDVKTVFDGDIEGEEGGNSSNSNSNSNTSNSIITASERNSAAVTSIIQQMKISGVVPDEISYGAAIDAHRRANNSLKAVGCLHDMYKSGIEPSASHYNLVLRTLRSEGYIDKMYKMVIAIANKEGAKINGNTFELVIEALLDVDKWQQALLLLRTMDQSSFRPSLSVYVTLVEKLERKRQFKAVLALYRAMVKDGYDFYENSVLNGIFKRMVSINARLSKVPGVAETTVTDAACGSLSGLKRDENEHLGAVAQYVETIVEKELVVVGRGGDRDPSVVTAAGMSCLSPMSESYV